MGCDRLAAKPAGKAFLPKVVLNGMSGRIMVDGEQILGIMPPLDSLSDEDIAAVLTYITGLDHKPVPFTAGEIKAALNDAEFNGHALNLRQAQQWIAQAQSLINRANALAAS